MGLIAKVANSLRRLIENKEDREDPSAGFLPFKIRLKVVSLINKDGNLLDIGCGEGLFLKRIPEYYNKRLYGLDPWELVIRKAKERTSASFIIGKGDKLPFKDERFNEITILNLFYNLPHIDDMVFIIKEALRVCKKGGRIFFDYRNKRNPLIWLGYRTVKLHDPDIKIPVNTYTRKEVKILLQTVGTERVNYYPVPSWWKVNSPVYVVETYKRVSL
jgi:ubiquinone/menaquinone biosynthesis C-methylase UbiE